MSVNASLIAVSSSLKHVVEGIQTGSIKQIVALTGAGISCAAGIPDFRSPGGLYDSLRPELLTATEQQRAYLRQDPTGVVNFDLFKVNQFPYLELRRPFILGAMEQRWKATLAHYFMKVLDDKKLLRRVYSQNIDGLDSQLQLDAGKVINVHGSLSEISCEFCGAEYPKEQFGEDLLTKIRNIYDENDAVAPKHSSNICCLQCRKAGVKPATVMFGRNLPKTVFTSLREDFPKQVDLMLIFGTSLTVYPAAGFVNEVREGVSRVVCNQQVVGENMGLNFGPIIPAIIRLNPSDASLPSIEDLSNERARDAIVLSSCDQAALYLAQELGWLDDLYQYKERMCPVSAELLELAYQSSRS